MKTKILVFSSFTITLFAIATVITVLFNLQPDSIKTISAFYIASFCSVFGATFLIMYGISYWRFRLTPSWQSTLFSLRVSTLLGLTTIILLAMGSYGILTPATAIVVLVIAFLTELVWRRRKAL